MNVNTIDALTTEVIQLERSNKKLLGEIALTKFKFDKCKNASMQLVKKDKIIYKLRRKIKSSVSFNRDMVPNSYLKISDRFPHLSLRQIIEFKKRV